MHFHAYKKQCDTNSQYQLIPADNNLQQLYGMCLLAQCTYNCRCIFNTVILCEDDFEEGLLFFLQCFVRVHRTILLRLFFSFIEAMYRKVLRLEKKSTHFQQVLRVCDVYVCVYVCMCIYFQIKIKIKACEVSTTVT